MNKKKEKNEFTGESFPSMWLLTKVNQWANIVFFPLSQMHTFLLLTFTDGCCCRGASGFTPHFGGEAPELCCHVTDVAPCWLFIWCVSAAVLRSLLVLHHFCDTQRFSFSVTLSTASLLSPTKWQLPESPLFLFDAFCRRSFWELALC